MSTALTTRPEMGFLTVDTFDQAIKVADYINKSALVPDAYRGKPADIVIAMQYGMELGLSPMQAIQSVAVINGKPSIYGDALPAVVMQHPDFMDIDASEPAGTEPQQWVATCTVSRRGRTPVTRTFSTADAQLAKLWGKAGPWQQMPKRMLMMRARAFALRDAFPDRMKGIITAEEAIDITPERVEPSEPRRLSETAPSVAPTSSTVSVDDQVWKASAQATAAPAHASPPPPADPIERGVRVLEDGTKWVDDGNGGFAEITTNRGVFVSRDKRWFESAATAEGSDTLLRVTWRKGHRKANGKQVECRILINLELDEEPHQPELPTGGGDALA
jgi:hypothetical protein